MVWCTFVEWTVAFGVLLSFSPPPPYSQTVIAFLLLLFRPPQKERQFANTPMDRKKGKESRDNNNPKRYHISRYIHSKEYGILLARPRFFRGLLYRKYLTERCVKSVNIPIIL